DRLLASSPPLPLSQADRAILRAVVRWHDWGKAHEVFQSTVKDEARPLRWTGNRFVAKAPDDFWRRASRAVGGNPKRVSRFRHELASALGVLELLRTGSAPDGWHQLSAADRDLALYLLAAHHGKVRLSVRAMPGERPMPPDPEKTLYAAGVWDGDPLPGT